MARKQLPCAPPKSVLLAGRVILPAREQRREDGAVFLEVHNAPPAFAELRGRTVWLRISEGSLALEWFRHETRNVVFSQDPDSAGDRRLHPDRLNGWDRVSPLESTKTD
ncbi:MAG: hypothetical protein H7A21_10155 [Spirochaetales bacterium]|nr:hypothetical protein [Leptospiraceae bacterium]MCP5481786.1 hypothetical protein [Spirochaetales bacterium]MCP5486902.1 hypothetical protein [Spirochaetales bacterium]